MDRRPRMTRDVFLNAFICPRLGWLERKGDFKRENALASRVNLQHELEIKQRMRNQYPQGVHVSERDFKAACKQTLTILRKKDTEVIFGAALEAQGYAARAEILLRKGGGWHLIETKQAIQVKQRYLDDVAYTAMVMKAAGLHLSAASLALISKDFRVGMEDKHLFATIDCTKEVRSLAGAFEVFMEPMDSITSGVTQPRINLMFECKTCPVFSQCMGGVEQEGHIFELPRLTQRKFNHLTKLRISYMFDIPEEFPLTNKQKIAMQCVRTGRPYVGNHLASMLSAISFPGCYLDFEPLVTPIPLYESIAPFEKIPVMYSIHQSDNVGSVSHHHAYLAKPYKDCREDFIEGLIRDIEKRGSVIVYTEREKTLLESLIRTFPFYASELNSVKARMVCLEAIIGAEFYHPDFRGCTSIECISPVLAGRDFSHETEIKAENEAIAAFASMTQGQLSNGEMDETRKKLSNYGRMKTYSMAQIYKALADYARG